jgi:heparan-sulfate lyase
MVKLLFMIFFILLFPALAPAQDEMKDINSVKGLLSRMDLDRPGLEKVKAAQDDPKKAAAELLAYFRSRTSVKHPIDRAERKKVRGKFASKKNLEIADDALKNILITAGVYPRYDFGKKINWFKRHKDMEWRVQLHRHYSWESLSKAYWHTGDEKYAQAYVRQLKSWLTDCNPYKKGTGIAWRRIEMGIRGYRWTRYFNYFLDSPSYTPDVLVPHLIAFHEHCVKLSSRTFTRNNWGLMEAEGQAFIAVMFPEFKKSEEWRKKAAAHLTREMFRQVRADGHHVEQCINYHNGCIHWFTRTAELFKMNDFKEGYTEKFWERLEKMVEVLMKLSFPNGTTPQFGDNHSVHSVGRNLEKWAGFFDRKDFLYVGTEGKEGKVPAETAFAFKQSGFYSMRNSWDKNAVCLILNCGPHGGWHDQPHNGTFEVFAGGRRLTPDSGCYIYHGDNKGRAWFKQTRVHQTMTLDLKNASQKKQKLLLWKPGNDLDIVVVENMSYKTLKHRRAILFVKKKFFVIVDEGLGSAAGNASIHFQLAPVEANIDEKGFTGITQYKDGTNLLIRSMAQEGMKLIKEQGQVSFKYGKKEPRPAFRFEISKKGDQKGVRFVTLIVPFTGPVPDTHIKLEKSAPPGASEVKLTVKVGKITETVGYTLKTKK